MFAKAHTSASWPAVIVFLLCFYINGAPAHSDTPYLTGIHWYSSNTASTDVEAMSGGRPLWVVDQALLDTTSTLAAPNPWETPWVSSPVVDKSQPYAKPAIVSAITAKGHSVIMRLHPQWSVNVPYPCDPYTQADFASDCKSAAELMRNVHIWQIGNEANLNGEMRRWNTSTQHYGLPWPAQDLANAPELYAQTYLACRDKIHEVNPSTSPSQQIVLMQPCSPGGSVAGTRYLSSDAFLTRMIAAVPDKTKIDGFALHSYAQPGGSNYGADGFFDDLRRQIAVIDQAGLGDRPIFITEFNKHMPNETEANTAAGFINTAYAMLHQWNTGAAALWPGGASNHAVRGTAWFVYRSEGTGTGWDEYSLEYWKSHVSSTSPTLNPWYSFQQACNQAYPAGATAGPILTKDNLWWEDSFNGATIDQSWPLPKWDVDAPAGSSVSAVTGEARISATGNFIPAGIRQTSIAFTDCAMELDLTLADAAPVAPGEANVDIRLRQEGSGGPGYSLTLFSSLGSASPGTVQLRRTSTWQVIAAAAIPGGINTGDQFRIRIWMRPQTLEIQVLRLPSLNSVLEWTGAKIPATEFRAGGVGVYTYNLKEARITNFKLGGLDSLGQASVAGWELY